MAKTTDSVEEAIEVLNEGASAAPVPKVTAEVVPIKPEEFTVLVREDEPTFDLHVENADVADFFRSLVAGTPYNLVLHPDVTGLVTLSLKDVTVSGVMQVMRDVYNYDFVLKNDVYQIFPDVLRTQIYHVNYLNVARSGRSETQVSAGKVSDAGNNNGSNNSGNNNNNTSGSNNNGNNGGSQSVVGTIVNTTGEADLWKELELTLVNIAAMDEGSNVMVTPQVGLVVVKAKPNTLRAIEDYLMRVENALSRQVVLETKIIEVTLNEGFQAGINWNTFGEDSGGTFAPVTTVLEDGTVVTTQGSERSVAGEFISGQNNIFNPLGTTFSLSAAFSDFEATLDLLATQGSVQVLSSPRIATVNNQKAVIKVGSDEFFVTDISSNTITAGNAININDSPELTPFFSGIALDVTPQISSDNEVILHVHPTVSEVTEQLKFIGGQLVPLASSTIRESDSIVKASSGQIVVIGGLMQNSSRDVNAGVPWLKQLPMVGNLFKQKNQSSIKSELVILLKPIVVELGTQSSLLGESSTRAALLRDQMRRRG
ncbi:MAG: pilus (MSHA type) biogenesis protein MshL [Pseudomonadaceae bacterium]|nr:pilus (MSHA type) biogenesis protein MshL [Pseudomonadaceae bacterium]